MRIGITISPLAGNLNAMTALARRLQSRGHEVIPFGPPDAAKGVANAGLPFKSAYEKIFPLGHFEKKYAELSKLSGEEAADYSMNWIREGCEAELQELPQLFREISVDGLVVDRGVSLGAGAVAMAMNIPFVHVSCSPLVDLSGIAPLCFYPWPYEKTDKAIQRNRKGVANFLEHTKKIRETIFKYMTDNNVIIDKENVHWTESSIAYLTQVPQVFDFPGDHLPKHFYRTGPFHDGTGREQIPFPWERLTGKPLIYVSLGTLVNGLDNVFQTILMAVERPGYQVVMSVGTHIDPGKFKTGQPDTIISPRIPQLEILKRTRLCVTHAGLNTTLEALAEGVPLVAIPITNDQPGVAARILASGTGLFLPIDQLTVEGLTKLAEEVLENPSYLQQAAKMKSAIDKVDGATLASELIEKAFRVRAA